MFSAVIFDLDGTLLDTLTDLRRALNEALKENGLPYVYSKKDCRNFIGNGPNYLLKQALHTDKEDEEFLKVKARYLELYFAYQEDHTKPYPGLKTVLHFLKERGVQLFVVTNKPQVQAEKILAKCFGDDVFQEIVGYRENKPPKPDPWFVTYLDEKYNLDKNSILFVGDSLPDLLTAKNSKIPLALVTWGYGNYKPSLLEESTYVIKKAKELVGIVYEHQNN